MARERLSAGDRKDILVEGVIKQAQILSRDGHNLIIRARKGGRGAFSKAFPVTTRKFWAMVDDAA